MIKDTESEDKDNPNNILLDQNDHTLYNAEPRKSRKSEKHYPAGYSESDDLDGDGKIDHIE